MIYSQKRLLYLFQEESEEDGPPAEFTSGENSEAQAVSMVHRNHCEPWGDGYSCLCHSHASDLAATRDDPGSQYLDDHLYCCWFRDERSGSADLLSAVAPSSANRPA